MIDPETLEFEINVDGLVSSGGLGGPAILPMSLANMARMCQAFPDKSVLGNRRRVRLRAGAVVLPARLRARCRCARRRCSIRRSGPNVIKRLNAGLDAFLERHADKGWTSDRRFPRHAARSRRGAIADPTAGRG